MSLIGSGNKLVMATAGANAESGGGGGSSSFLAPITSRSSTNDYIHFLNADGFIVNTVELSGLILNAPEYYRYQNYYYVFLSYTSSSWIKIDLSTFTIVSTGSVSSAYGRGRYSPISDSQLIRVSAPDQKYYIFDMATGQETGFSYTAGTNTGIAQTHGTLTFYDITSSGLANVSNQVWWSAAEASSGSYPAEVNYATLSGLSLGARTTISDGANYSRNYALTIDSNYGLMWIFDSQLHRITASGSFYDSISPQSFIGTDGKTYSYRAPESKDKEGGVGVGATGNVYGTWRATVSATEYLFNLCYFDPITSTSPTATELLTFPAGGIYDYSCPEMCILPLNEAGWVFVAYFDLTSNDRTIVSAIFDGTTQIGNTNQDTIPPSQAGNPYSGRGSPSAQSYHGPVLPGTQTQ